MRAKDVAKLANISVRTLHHYDEIGLLCPKRNDENGYREYYLDDISKLQQILFFKQCGFSLEKIKKLLQSPKFNKEEAFEIQKKHLLHEKARIEKMINVLEKSKKALKGEITMTNKEKFEGFDFSSNPYEEEARERWGDDAVDESNSHIAALSKEERHELNAGMEDILKKMAEVMTCKPESEPAQKATQAFFEFLNNSFGYKYSYEAFAGLGQLYILDERFTKGIDAFGKGLANFLAKSMAVFAENNMNK